MVIDIGYFGIFLAILMVCALPDMGKKGLKEILVPTDFSESSDTALQIAIDLAVQQNARIHLLHVLPFRHGGKEREMMERQLAGFPGAKSVEIVREIRKGKPHEEILKAEKERSIDLIVIGRHNKKEHVFVFFRSVTEKVKKGAQCSVLVVGA